MMQYILRFSKPSCNHMLNNKMVKGLKSYFTLKFQYQAFRDVVSGKMVNVYIDCFEELYMKDNRWSLFSVKKDRGHGVNK